MLYPLPPLCTLQGRVLTPAEMSSAEDLSPPPFKRMAEVMRALLLPGSGSVSHRQIHLGVSLARAATTSAAVSNQREGSKALPGSLHQRQEAALRRLVKEQGHNK